MNKHKIRNIRILGVVLLVLVFWSHSAAAYSWFSDDQKRGSRDRRDFSFHHPPIGIDPAEHNLYDARTVLGAWEELALTGKQAKKIEDLMMEHMAAVIRRNGEIKIKELQFTAYLRSGEMDRKEVARLVRAIGDEKAVLYTHYLNHLLDVKAVLTPAQLKKMAERYAREKKKMKKTKRRVGRASAGDSKESRD